MKSRVLAALWAGADVLASNPNAAVFACGLCVLCASVARWSGPLAGTIFGVVLMLVAAWPFLQARKH